MTDSIPEIDVARLRELMSDYEAARSPSRKREIENEVLAETVWKVPAFPGDEILPITKAQLESLSKYVPDDDLEGQRILRAPAFRKVWEQDNR